MTKGKKNDFEREERVDIRVGDGNEAKKGRK